MSTYPQGVSSFIPDYQPYEPDFNFALNALQLKQTQYDQNWSKLNNIYGQIANAPLSHGESAERRANTLNSINMDLQRVTGLDLSLDQNVHQATQVFRPFYEDKNLMKDIAFTKNAMSEKSLGEGMRLSSDDKVRERYWAGGLRYIDEKVKEFQELPYDQLTSFGDVKYVPYVNVEKKALELAKEMDLSIDVTQPDKSGNWMVRTKNGQPLIPRLQSVFYSTLGNDPEVQEMYGAQAYLKRKNYIAANADSPQFQGDKTAAERYYLENALSMLKKQSTSLKDEAKDDKQTNDRKIMQLEAQVRAGDNSARTLAQLDKLKKANQVTENSLNTFEKTLETVSGNKSKTLTTEGGAELSFDDIQNMRARVDASVANIMLQADLNQAAVDASARNMIVDYQANPFAVQRQKFAYDQELLRQRKEYQKEVDNNKAAKEQQKIIDEARLKSGLYYRDLDNGEVKIKPEFQGARKLGIVSDTESTDPIKMQKLLDESIKGEATQVKNQMRKTLESMFNEGQLSARDIRYILGDKVAANGFNMDPLFRWLSENVGKDNAPIPEEIRNTLAREGLYTTSLEEEMEGVSAGTENAKGQLLSLALGKIDAVSPAYLSRMTKRLGEVINNMSADDRILNNTSIMALNEATYGLDNYVEYEDEVRENYKKLRTEVSNKLKAEGFNYGAAFFDPVTNRPVTSQEEFVKNALLLYPDEIQTNTGMSWAGYLNTISSTGLAGGAVGAAPTLGLGAAPGFLIGAATGAVVYPAVGLFNYAYNSLFGSDDPGSISGNYESFKDGAASFFGSPYNLVEEFEAMQHTYDELVKNSEIKTIPIGIATKPLLGGGTGYTVEATGVSILPGARGESYNQWLELQKTIDNNLDLQQPSENNYVSFTGPEQKYDELSEDQVKENYKIFNVLYEDLKLTTATAPPGDKKAQKFDIGIVPFATGDVGNASVLIRMPKEFLDQYYDPKDESKGLLSGDEYENLLKNGLNIITDASKLNQTTMYQNAFDSAEEVAIKRAGAKGKTYTSWNVPGFSVNYKYDEADPTGRNIIVTKEAPVYMGPDQPYATQKSYENIRLGSNIAYDRSKFFNEDAIKITMNNLKSEQEYGTAKSE